MRIACILLGGPVLTIAVDGVDYRFEMHPYFGPMPVTKRDRERRLGSRHRFWVAVTAWDRQGKKVSGERCEWQEPPSPLDGMVHLGGKHYGSPAVAAGLRRPGGAQT